MTGSPLYPDTLEALRKVRAFVCEHAQADAPHQFLSVRGVCCEVGCDADLTDLVLDACAAGGFVYCLDPRRRSPGGIWPHPDVCAWMPDQLLSRLDCLPWDLRSPA